MPKPFQRRMKRVYKRTAKGVKLTFKKKKESPPKCASCGKVLHGVKRNKVVNRMFGGNLCASCARRELIRRIRAKVSTKPKE